MSWGYEERRRRERNYRLMFKCALAFCAVGIAVTILGGAAAIVRGDDGLLFAFGLMLAALSGISAWFSVDSTVRIIELDVNERVDER